MRTIKFRCWDNRNRKIVYPVGEDTTDRITSSSLLSAYNDGGIEELMQYTGLKDLRGVEIYEGDIVKIIEEGRKESEIIKEVIWSEELGAFYAEDILGLFINSTRNDKYVVEVIGNIYENKELLKTNENIKLLWSRYGRVGRYNDLPELPRTL